MSFSRRSIIALLSVLLLALAIAVAGYWLASQPPPWYRPAAFDDPQSKQLGETAEYRLVEEFQKIRPDDSTWRLRIPEPAINAWLSTRLVRWMSGRGIDWPEGVGVPQVRMASGDVTLAIPLAELGGWFGTLSMVPAFDSGALIVETRGGLGRLPLTFASSHLQPYFNEFLGNHVDSEPMLALLLNQSAVTGVPLADDRIVVIENITLEDGAIVLSVSTQPAQ